MKAALLVFQACLFRWVRFNIREASPPILHAPLALPSPSLGGAGRLRFCVIQAAMSHAVASAHTVIFRPGTPYRRPLHLFCSIS